MMRKIVVEGKTTYEIIGQRMEFDSCDIEFLRNGRLLQIEQKPYDEIRGNVLKAINHPVVTERVSRRIVVHHDGCESVLQFLLGRGEFNTLIVHMRSSSFKKLDSDLSFFAELAQTYDCQNLIVNFGSLHYIIGEENYL